MQSDDTNVMGFVGVIFFALVGLGGFLISVLVQIALFLAVVCCGIAAVAWLLG